jgi:hypothetical protein
MVLRNAGILTQHYTASESRRPGRESDNTCHTRWKIQKTVEMMEINLKTSKYRLELV